MLHSLARGSKPMFPQSNENREKRIVSKESTRITETQNV